MRIRICVFFLLTSIAYSSNNSHLNKSGKVGKELAVDGDLYCSVVSRKLVKVYEDAPLEARLERYSGHLKELIIVMDYKAQERRDSLTEKHPKCLEQYKILVAEELKEIKKLSTDSYEKAILEGDYKYIVGEYREAKASYARASQILGGDINSGTKELASIVQILDRYPRERDNIDYWQKDIRLIFKGMNRANKSRPEIQDEIKKMSKDLGVRLVRILNSIFGYAHASFSFTKLLNFGAGIGHSVEGTPEAEVLSQRFVRSKGFSQLILTREDLMDLIKEKVGKGGSLKKALGTLFPSSTGDIEIKITQNITNVGSNKDDENKSDINEKQNEVSPKGVVGATTAGKIVAVDKNGKAWDPAKPLSQASFQTDPKSWLGGYTTADYESFGKSKTTTGTSTTNQNDPIVKALAGSDKTRHEKLQEKKALCIENPSAPECQNKGGVAGTNTDREIPLTEGTQAPIIIAAASPTEEVKKPEEKKKEESRGLAQATKATKKKEDKRELVKPQKEIVDSKPEKFNFSPNCGNSNAVSTVLSTVRDFQFNDDLTKAGNSINALGDCHKDWNNLITSAKDKCGGVVGASKRCGGTKEGDAAACKESVKAVSGGMAQEFYGGSPSDVTDAVKSFSETGELPKDHMSGVVCEFAGLVSVGNALRNYAGGGSGTSTSGTSGLSPGH
ncbi:MAG: hypothetical protein R3C42_10045 [Parvularculaceae bacterium]